MLRIRIRIRIRKDPKLLAGSGSEINILDPDSDLDSNPDSNPDLKPDPKQIFKILKRSFIGGHDPGPSYSLIMAKRANSCLRRGSNPEHHGPLQPESEAWPTGPEKTFLQHQNPGRLELDPGRN